ncbi:MAG: M23 family metallopeptidase [Deltaproteobacteria bacterium]|nr:M23 family metallopeptidase [Deltaproteobacteria bacterium]
MSARTLFRWALAGVDVVAALLAGFVMTTSTPVGSVVLGAASWAFELHVQRPPIASFFRAREEERLAIAPALPDAPLPIPELPGTATPTTSVSEANVPAGRTAKHHSDRALARAVLETFDLEQVELDTSFAELAFAERGRDARILEVLGKLVRDLGGEEPAVAALVLGPARVQRAMDRARTAGRDPLRWSRFSRHLTPGSRMMAEPFVLSTLARATAYELKAPLRRELVVTSAYGERSHPVLGTKHQHRGVDLAAAVGTEVLASGDGVVARVREDDVSGRYFEIDHGHGVSTVYCHNSEVIVQTGDVVRVGQVVARSGNTGRSTGPHLHFQLELDGRPVDPAPFLGLSSRIVSSRPLMRTIGVLARWLGAA